MEVTFSVDRRDRDEVPVLDELAQQLGVVDDVVVAAAPVLVGEGVEAVRAGRHDLDVVLAPARRPLRTSTFCWPSIMEDELVAEAAAGVTGAGLARHEYGELDAGGVQQLGEGAE